MKKILLVGLAVALLTGCSEKSGDSISVIFKNEIAAASKIEDSVGKELDEEILREDVEKLFQEILDQDIFKDAEFELDYITQGIGADGNGGRVFCYKLPVTVKFTGDKSAVHKFVEYFENVDKVISFGEFKIDEKEEGVYEVSSVINILGKDAGSGFISKKQEYTFKKNEVEVAKEEDIVLRDYDISMTVRPSNSDASAISLGVNGDKDYRVYSDENGKEVVSVTFSNEGNKYYCEYKIGADNSTKAQIKPNGDILFDILSCDIEEKDDKVATDLKIINNSNKKVSTMIYNDKDKRVNVIEKTGSVEVKNK